MRKKSMLKKSVILSTLTLLLLLMAATAFAKGDEPPEPLPAGLSSDNHFKWGIYERYFDVYIPENVNGPVPLVLDMHGLTGTKEKARESHGFYDLAVEEGFIVAWPQGIARSWNGQWCCPPAGTLNVDDVGFLTELVFWISDRANVDISRVYATGHSNGGAVTNQLGLRSADVFAAIVPVSFQLTELATVFRRPTRPMPMLEIHGNTDKTVRYPEGIGFGSVEDGFDDWARFNG